MLWRRAIQAKSVQTAQTSPLSSCVSNRRTGQSNPALGFDVMNCVPSGGLPNTSRVDGRSLMPAAAASFDWSISSKKLDALGCNIRLDAADRLGHRNRALDADDAVVAFDPGIDRRR